MDDAQRRRRPDAGGSPQAEAGGSPQGSAQTEADRASITEATTAVAASMRPALLDAVRDRAVTWPATDPVDDVAAVLRSAMEGAWHQDRTVPFWEATGPQLTAALVIVVRDLDEAVASHLIGAALHAHVLGRADTAPDAILRLAERAACWRQGRLDRR